MKVSEVMTREVRTVAPYDTVTMVARAMSETDVGAIPVCEGDILLGIITDRDIVVRVLAEERDGEVRVRDVMTPAVATCEEDADVRDAMQKMSSLQMRRLVITDARGKMTGILSLGDVARAQSARSAGHVLEEISEG